MEIKKTICDYLEIDKCDTNTVKDAINRIEIFSDDINIVSQEEELFDMRI